MVWEKKTILNAHVQAEWNKKAHEHSPDDFTDFIAIFYELDMIVHTISFLYSHHLILVLAE